MPQLGIEPRLLDLQANTLPCSCKSWLLTQDSRSVLYTYDSPCDIHPLQFEVRHFRWLSYDVLGCVIYSGCHWQYSTCPPAGNPTLPYCCILYIDLVTHVIFCTVGVGTLHDFLLMRKLQIMANLIRLHHFPVVIAIVQNYERPAGLKFENIAFLCALLCPLCPFCRS